MTVAVIMPPQTWGTRVVLCPRPGACLPNKRLGLCWVVALAFALTGFWTNVALAANEPAAFSLANPVRSRNNVSVDFLVDNWQTEEGLPDNTVTAILQTRDGYLWIGSLKGLSRFDGLRFVEASLVAGNAPSPRVSALFEDRAGRLWVGTDGQGLFGVAPEGWRVFNSKNGLLNDSVTCLAEDVEGQIWIGTRAGLSRFGRGVIKNYTTRDGLPHDFVTGVHMGHSGSLWISTRTGLCQYRSGHILPFEFPEAAGERNMDCYGVYEDRFENLWAYGDTFLINLTRGKRFNYFKSSDPLSSRVWAMCEDQEGGLWIGTSGRGLFQFVSEQFSPVNIPETLMPSDVRALWEDREGNLWIGSNGGGLCRLRSSLARHYSAPEGLPAEPVLALAEDSSRRLWMSTDGAGLYSWRQGRFERFQTGTELDNFPRLGALLFSRDGALWGGSWGGGLFRFKEGLTRRFSLANGLADDVVISLAEDGLGRIWIGTLSGVLHGWDDGKLRRFSTTEGLPGLPINVIRTASDNTIWIGTSGGGLYHGENGRFSAVGSPRPKPMQNIQALFEDRRGRLWVGTAGNGLACLDGTEWRFLSSTNGLQDDDVFQILEDDLGALWIGTGRGIGSLPARTIDAWAKGVGPSPRIVTFPMPVGLANAKSTRGLKRADGRLCFVTTRGLIEMDPKKLSHPPAPMPVVLEQVLVNGDLVLGAWPLATTSGSGTDNCRPRPAEPLIVTPRLQRLELRYTALNLTSPEKIRFKYRMDGLDTDWIEAGSRREALYGRLPPGQYRFRVMASNAEGIWNPEGDSLALLIPTPIWQSWWFMSLAGLGAILPVAGVVRWLSFRRLRRKLQRTEQQRAMEKERTRIAQDMHDEIGAKLTRISFLSELAKRNAPQPAEAQKQIDSIAMTSRELLQALDEIVWAVNPRNDTLEHLAAYIGQFTREYFQMTDIECSLSMPGPLPHVPLSAEVRHNLFLAVEEALNNLLKHSGATRAQITMTLQQATFEIRIADNGRGIPGSVLVPPTSVDSIPKPQVSANGLLNMRQRLAAIGGHCEIGSHPAQGTQISLSFPLGVGING